MLDVLGGNANVFGEATRVDVGGFESVTHRVVLVTAIMASTAGDMVGDDDALTDLEVRDDAPVFNDCACQFVSQDDWRWSLLSNLDDVGPAESTTMDLDKQFLVCNRWSRPVFYANVVIGVVDYCFHGTYPINPFVRCVFRSSQSV